MSRYTGPTWKISRRLGYSTSETGKELLKRNYAPGQHGQRRGKLKEYGIQLQEKQRVRFTYGVSEKQFKKTFNEASKLEGMTSNNFLRLLELRLDNLVYRLGFASTRKQARQLVNHGHITVNGKKVDIPSYRVSIGQTIAVKEASRNFVVIKSAMEGRQLRAEYLTYDADKFEGSLVRLPERDEFLTEINAQLIVEYYNR